MKNCIVETVSNWRLQTNLLHDVLSKVWLFADFIPLLTSCICTALEMQVAGSPSKVFKGYL